MHTDLIGNLLHLQRLNRLGTLFQKLALIIDDGLRNFLQCRPPLLNRIDQPLRPHNFLLDKLTFRCRRFATHQTATIVFADAQRREPIVLELHHVFAMLIQLHDHVGSHRWNICFHEGSPRLGIEQMQFLFGFLDHLDRETRLLLNQG